MFLKLEHTKLDVYRCSKELVISCYQQTKQFPDSERFALTQQIRRAALSVHLNIAEGCSRKSTPERKRYFEVSRGSTVEIDTGLDVANALKFCSLEDMQQIGSLLMRIFSMLSALIQKK